MRGLALGVLVVIACRYDEPATSALFKCDMSHGCPDGERCVGGLCQWASDSRTIACGTTTTGAAQTCAADQKCCVTAAGASCVAANVDCGSEPAALCDGAEDCAGGTVCCSSVDDPGGDLGSPVHCTPQPCYRRACTPDGAGSAADLDDCPPTEPFCCPDLISDQIPWGTCSYLACM